MTYIEEEKTEEILYNLLSEDEKGFADYLIEKRGYEPMLAIGIANHNKYYHTGYKIEPRLQEIVEQELKTSDNLVKIKNNMKRYRSDEFSDYERAIIWYRVKHMREPFEEAMNSIWKSNCYVEIVGYFDEMADFGEYIVNNRDYLDEFSNWEELQYIFKPEYQDLSQDEFYDWHEWDEVLDYGKLAETELEYWETHYDRVDDPERPDYWMFVYKE